ncbi:MAG: non-canonical purine NTP pyrophosphatase [Myxococcales bacterium]|nr:non-canonical purine NTP pyrophosphatase [Myxococcales bacterium]
MSRSDASSRPQGRAEAARTPPPAGWTWPPSPLVIASHNAGKVREMYALLAPLGVPLHDAASLGVPAPDEPGDSFEENAAIKARAVAAASGWFALADDSGVVVPALGGAPGVHTARWAERADGRRDFALAIERLHRAFERLGPGADPRCAYVCALSLAAPDGRVLTARGEVAGRLVWPPRGHLGSGLEPIFEPAGGDKTYAELDPGAKARDNPRARAYAALTQTLPPRSP